MSRTVPFLTIQLSISTQFKCKYSLIVKNISISSYSVLPNNSNSNNSVYQTYAVSSIQPIDRALSGATTPGLSGPGSVLVLCIPRIFIITGTSHSDCLLSYPGLSYGRVYFTAPADWVIESFVCLDLGLNPSLPDHCRILYSLIP